MIILGIETSCDDTSAALYNDQKIIANVISTQLVHRNFGGVVPELASRAHIELIIPVIKQAIQQPNLSLKNLDGVAVTYGPGLAGSLLVGLSVAKGLALSLNIPLIGINHLEGHIWANLITHSTLKPPFIVLIASGGHTQLVSVESWGKYKVLGRTRDDAAGEAFEKVGKLLEVGYPGGPVIEKLAKKGNKAYFHFPRAYLENDSLDFSFSGLKTAVLNHTQSIAATQVSKYLPDIAACFQEAVIDVLTKKTISAAKEMKSNQICLAGGVAVNQSLQKLMMERAQTEGIEVFWPSPSLCMDNAAMIARAGYFYLKQDITSSLSLAPNPSLNFSNDT